MVKKNSMYYFSSIPTYKCLPRNEKERISRKELERMFNVNILDNVPSPHRTGK